MDLIISIWWYISKVRKPTCELNIIEFINSRLFGEDLTSKTYLSPLLSSAAVRSKAVDFVVVDSLIVSAPIVRRNLDLFFGFGPCFVM